ncbi:hypothetical protein CDD82_2059 [Ophiocordyceps australis]|uniref:protein-L-isoaspartate(D-aspartate) O-methyltransferase n=1 Tax=Ophiocordyceps australis TaxID=1399860 RepID=A0A2C5ZIZ7_9HYPO|nr:hypothetical protein CDD82_2059 [Ophiocordyceps australis]
MWRHGLITQARVRAAFEAVDRGHYAPGAARAYQDAPQSIGHGATISAPHMHAAAAENVLGFMVPGGAARVLDVGSGSGYLTHVLAELAGEGARVVGLEHVPALRDLGEANMRRSQRGRELLESARVEFVLGDGRLGWEEEGGKWHVIHVGAAAKEVHPQLLAQLEAPGCMFIPVDDDEHGTSQHIWRIQQDKDGNVSKKRLFQVRYVPLTDAPST